MGARKQRAEAVTKLKDALTRQFGETARSAVEAHVDATLGGGKGQIDRQALDTIERGILGTMRQTRGSTKTNRLSKSAPFLPGASASVASTQGATAFAPLTPARVMPKIPIGTSNPGALVRSASAPNNAADDDMAAVKRKTYGKAGLNAPYGTSVVGGSQFACESARSGVTTKFSGMARYPVPKPPKLKPMDHWDLMVAFDSHKYRVEERALVETGNEERMQKFKRTLDDQMVEIEEGRQAELRGKEEERIMMTAQIIENKKYKQEEEDILHKKKSEQGAINKAMLSEIDRYKDKLAARAKKEEEEMTAWLVTEKAQRDEDEREEAIEHARKCARAKKELEENRAERERRRKADEENELRLMKIRDQIADEQEAKKQKALQDRKDHIDKIAATMGAAVAERDAADQADLEAKIKRIQDEANRASFLDAKNRADTHHKKVEDMKAVRKKQIEYKHKDEAQEKLDGEAQARRYKEEHEEAKRQEAEKLEKRRKAREDLDATLIGQIRINAVIHPHHVMMTPRNKKTELGYNKAIFEQMQREDFMVDSISTIHAQPGKDHHPEGKLLPYPTIPRYQGEIHVLDLEQPDV